MIDLLWEDGKGKCKGKGKEMEIALAILAARQMPGKVQKKTLKKRTN